MTQPTEEHKSLGFWIGTWDLEARAHPNPLFPEGEYQATMTADWFPGEFHVFCRFEWTGAMGPFSELNMLTYDAASQDYLVISIESFGGTTLFRGKPRGDSWPFITEMNVEGKTIAFRWTVNNESPGLITWTSELSADGGEWILAGECRATRS